MFHLQVFLMLILSNFGVDIAIFESYNSGRNGHLSHARRKKMNGQLKRFFILTGSIIIMSVGIYFFKFANNFSFGGVTGLAVIIAKLGWMSASTFSSVSNIVLLVIGFIFLGRDFAIRTTYCTVLLSAILSVLEYFFPMGSPLTDQPMLELVFAIALPAFGGAILFNIGASSGGTDVIAAILRKYTSVNIGRALIYTDVVFAASSFFIFDIKTGLYSILGLAIRSLMIDNFIESFNLSKYFNVVCDDPEPICDYIKQELNRSASIIHAKGAFSGKDKYIVLTAMNRHQAVLLRNFIRENAPTAFILISNTSEIIGKGFHTV